MDMSLNTPEGNGNSSNNPLYISTLDTPESFPKTFSIYCFHPKIAETLVRFIGWLGKRWK
jgi:hypothetical protein